MPQLLVYEKTGAQRLAALLGGMPVTRYAEPTAALLYCYIPHQFDIIILELEQLHPSDTVRSAKELLFFDEVNLLYHGIPLVIVAPKPELFIPDLKRFGFERMVDLDFMMAFLSKKRESNPDASLGEYAAYAIGVPTPVPAAQFRRLIEVVRNDRATVRVA